MSKPDLGLIQSFFVFFTAKHFNYNIVNCFYYDWNPGPPLLYMSELFEMLNNLLDLTKFDMTCESDTNSTRFLSVWVEYNRILVKFVLTCITHLINRLYSCQSAQHEIDSFND